jgi:hypothetical protein
VYGDVSDGCMYDSLVFFFSRVLTCKSGLRELEGVCLVGLFKIWCIYMHAAFTTSAIGMLSFC